MVTISPPLIVDFGSETGLKSIFFVVIYMFVGRSISGSLRVRAR